LVMAKNFLFFSCTCVLCLVSCVFVCFAKDIGFEITVDRNQVQLGEPLQLELTFQGTQDMPAIELSDIDGFQSRYLGPSTKMSIVNGRVTSSITHIYTLLPVKEGAFKIGPFRLEYKGDTYTSNSLGGEVVKGPVLPAAGSQAPQGAGGEDLSNRLFLLLQPQRSRIYVNDIVPVAVKLYANDLSVKVGQFPDLSHENLFLGPFDPPKQYKGVIDGAAYDVIEYKAELSASKPGEFKLGPATLPCDLLVRKQAQRRGSSSFEDFFGTGFFGDFFGGVETYHIQLKSPDILVTVMPLPEQSKPEGFSGAVGRFDMEASAGPQEVRVADPVTLKVIVTGEGNFNSVELPRISSGNDFKAYEPQIKLEPGRKSFEQVILPMNASVQEVPALRFSFFDTQAGEYRTLVKGPFPLKVSKPEKEEEFKMVEAPRQGEAPSLTEKLGRDIVYIKDSPGRFRANNVFLFNNRIFILAQFLFLLVFFCLCVFNARRERLKTDVRYARRLLAPSKAKEGLRKAREHLAAGREKEFYDILFETLQQYLGDRFHLPSHAITAGIVDEILKDRPVPQEVLDKLRSLFIDCDRVRFAASQTNRFDMQDSLKRLEEVLDYFQRQKII
jgi:hypothetical protein